MSHTEHTCGLRGCDGPCRCGGYGYVPPGYTVNVCRCDRHVDEAFEAAKWTCRECGVEGYDNDLCGCDEAAAMWGPDQAAPTRGFLGDAAW